MIRTLPLLALFPFCISCSYYQYSTVSSDRLTKNDKNEFVLENDTLRLVYNFCGRNAPVNITIQNKLQVPVYIDWQRSALVLNDKTVTYAPNELKIDGSYRGGSYNFGRSGYGVNSGHIQASASLPPTVDFIPPTAFLTKNPLVITNRYIDSIPETAFKRTKYAPVEGLSVTVNRAAFTKETSPLRFRSFLTYMVGEPTARPQSIEHSFYVSEMMNTFTGPGTMLINKDRLGNQFYVSKSTGAGTALGVIAGAAAVAVVATQVSDK
ncbi:hypothetical protein [Longitalea luteola]|uniref:hypothetical protein n=1 Tax=Longitalea luteola TaxID=2812563 RepID=UPI001A95F58E|nr:hypothetical protein [Longitalea luteola]